MTPAFSTLGARVAFERDVVEFADGEESDGDARFFGRFEIGAARSGLE